MEDILLMVPNRDLRQLYHELLFSKDLEIIPADSFSMAILLLMARRFSTLALHVDEENMAEAEAFLKLRRDKHEWIILTLVILTEEKLPLGQTLKSDVILDPTKYSPLEIAELIKKAI